MRFCRNSPLLEVRPLFSFFVSQEFGSLLRNYVQYCHFSNSCQVAQKATGGFKTLWSLTYKLLRLLRDSLSLRLARSNVWADPHKLEESIPSFSQFFRAWNTFARSFFSEALLQRSGHKEEDTQEHVVGNVCGLARRGKWIRCMSASYELVIHSYELIPQAKIFTTTFPE